MPDSLIPGLSEDEMRLDSTTRHFIGSGHVLAICMHQCLKGLVSKSIDTDLD